MIVTGNFIISVIAMVIALLCFLFFANIFQRIVEALQCQYPASRRNYVVKSARQVKHTFDLYLLEIEVTGRLIERAAYLFLIAFCVCAYYTYTTANFKPASKGIKHNSQCIAKQN